MKFYFIHIRAYGHYLMQYPPTHKHFPNQWVWSLDRKDAQTFNSVEEAESFVKQFPNLKREDLFLKKQN